MDTKNNLVHDSFLARRLKVSRSWLRAEADAGRLPCVKADDRYLFDKDLVTEMLLARAQGGHRHAS